MSHATPDPDDIPDNVSTPNVCPSCGSPGDEEADVDVDIEPVGRQPGAMVVYTVDCSDCGAVGVTVPEGDVGEAGRTIGQALQGSQQGRRPGHGSRGYGGGHDR
jgi:hypothetical protein